MVQTPKICTNEKIFRNSTGGRFQNGPKQPLTDIKRRLNFTVKECQNTMETQIHKPWQNDHNHLMNDTGNG